MSTINVPKDYQRIQSAINAADPGDEIVVQTGTYPETLSVTTNCLTICGEGRVLITGMTPYVIGISIDAHHVTLRNLNFENFDTGVFLFGDKNMFLNVASMSNTNAGFEIIGDHNVVEQCRMTENLDSGVVLSGNENLFIENTLDSNGINGLVSGPYEFRENIIANNQIYNTGRVGINLNSSSSDRNVIFNNLIQDSKNGIIASRGRFFIGFNTMSNIEYIGILSQGNSSIILGNQISQATNGIQVRGNNCFIRENVVGPAINTTIMAQGHRNVISLNTVNHFGGIGILANGDFNTIRKNTPITTVTSYAATGLHNRENESNYEADTLNGQEINIDNFNDNYRGLLELFYRNFD